MHVRCKTTETAVFNVSGNSLPDPLIIGTFEKRGGLIFAKTSGIVTRNKGKN